MSVFIEPFIELGCKLEDAFRRAQYAESAFSDLAVEHVMLARLHEHFDLAALARWVLSGRGIPPQEDIEANFGDPPVTLWNGRRFFVSVIVWGSSTTSIHQHAFTGAFQVLEGSSVHARFAFAPSYVVSEDFCVGALQCSSIEYLTKGATRSIPANTGGIHSLFHLEHPSVSLVVRTHSDHRYPIQLDYHPPGLAIWDQRREPALQRARQIAKTLVRLDRTQAEAVISEALPGMTAFDAFWILDEARREGKLALSLQLLARCRSHLHPVVGDAFEEALREDDRRDLLFRRREQVRDPALRYFLAILLNASTRHEVLTLARAYAPLQPPEESIIAWLAKLPTVKLKLQAGGIPWEPSVLGLPDPDNASLSALRSMLADKPIVSTGQLQFYEAIRRNPAFTPLFRA